MARNPTTGQHRTMLIDAGLPGYAATVHRYVAQALLLMGIPTLDHILASHYDDHAGGVIGLLKADNLYQLAAMMTPLITNAALLGANRAKQVACAAMAATAIVGGVYNDPNGYMGAAAQMLAMGTTMLAAGVPILGDADASNWGIEYALKNLPLPRNAGIPLGTTNRNRLARTVGVIAANAIAAVGATPATVALAVGATVLQRLMMQLPAALRFRPMASTLMST